MALVGNETDLLIVGAGPSGLAVAIAADRAGLDYEVIEKGVLVNSIFHFPRAMTFFTTPDLLEIGGLPFVTPYEKPTQWEALRYYRRVADTYRLRIALGEEVLEIRRVDHGFALLTRSAAEGERTRRTRHVAFATGYYDHPNRLGVPGEDLPHVTHYYDEPHPWYRRPVVIVGGKNSAAIAALELCRAGATVTLVHRGPQLADSIKYWIKPDIENRIKDGAVRALFETRVVEIRERSVVVEGRGRAEIAAEGVFLMTGYRPETRLLAEAGVRIDRATLKPQHDPQTLETNVPGLFLAGSVAAGLETSKVFIETGRFHGEAIVKALTARATPSPQC
jgi:bacillithiol disulfide reductase